MPKYPDIASSNKNIVSSDSAFNPNIIIIQEGYEGEEMTTLIRKLSNDILHVTMYNTTDAYVIIFQNNIARSVESFLLNGEEIFHESLPTDHQVVEIALHTMGNVNWNHF